VLDHLTRLSEVGKTADGGVSRVAYSDFDREGRSLASGWMREAGLEVTIDEAANLVGTRAGSEPGLPPLVMGSHIDTVPSGGNYDGTVGSLGAIEVAHALWESGIRTRHPIEVILFQNEEGGKTGSRALSGELELKELALTTLAGKTIGEGIRFLGGDPERLAEVVRGPGRMAAYLELHVEQGGILDRDRIDVGVVEGIVGIKRYDVAFEGFANHAGTTPMRDRQDALVAAARFVDAVYRTVSARPGRSVGTVGRIQASPGAPNVIPGRAALTLELRDLQMDVIDSLFDELGAIARVIARDTRTTATLQEFYVSRAAPTDERLRRVIEEAARGLGLSTLRLPSGAGHDAQSLASLCPMGMIFVPSVGGISHSPKELTKPEDVVNGVNVLSSALLKVDAEPRL